MFTLGQQKHRYDCDLLRKLANYPASYHSSTEKHMPLICPCDTKSKPVKIYVKVTRGFLENLQEGSLVPKKLDCSRP